MTGVFYQRRERDYITLVNPGGCASKPLKSRLLRGIREYSLSLMNPRGVNVNQIENQTLLVIRDYSLRS